MTVPHSQRQLPQASEMIQTNDGALVVLVVAIILGEFHLFLFHGDKFPGGPIDIPVLR